MDIQGIARLTEAEIGPSEEDVKQKVMVPLLELLGHKRETLAFERYTKRGGRIDILIKDVPGDCKVLIDTKNYNETLGDFTDQVKEYTFDEGALLAVIVNGSEIRIYSPLRGVAFERSLLYALRRQNLTEKPVWDLLVSLLGHQNLKSRDVHKTITEREGQIKAAMLSEEHLEQEYRDRIEGIDTDIEAKQEEIEQLRNERGSLEREAKAKRTAIWQALSLPLEVFGTEGQVQTGVVGPDGTQGAVQGKARKVILQELLDAGLARDGQVLRFFHGRAFPDEQAEIVATQNKLKYRRDGKLYSISELARIVDVKLGLKRDDHGVAGPRYWQTEDGRLLHNLNEVVRKNG